MVKLGFPSEIRARLCLRYASSCEHFCRTRARSPIKTLFGTKLGLCHEHTGKTPLTLNHFCRLSALLVAPKGHEQIPRAQRLNSELPSDAQFFSLELRVSEKKACHNNAGVRKNT
jgi:hypothetical protein